jgi:hypothetical protein
MERAPYPYKGALQVYDISAGQPVNLPALKKSQFLPAQIGAYQYSHWQKSVDIEVDHSDTVSEECRIVIMEKTQNSSYSTYFVKYDADMNLLATQPVSGSFIAMCLSTNPNDPDGICLIGKNHWGAQPWMMDRYQTFTMPTDW